MVMCFVAKDVRCCKEDMYKIKPGMTVVVMRLGVVRSVDYALML